MGQCRSANAEGDADGALPGRQCLGHVLGPARPGEGAGGGGEKAMPNLRLRAEASRDAQEFSDVERAIETLIRNFHQYSVQGGKETLTSSELRDLVTQQLPHLMPSNCGLEERIANLGSCDDSKLEFGSFWELIGEAAKSVKLESPAARGS